MENPATATDAKAPTRIYNPEYTAWHQQDAAILSAIMSTSTESVQGIILFATTAYEAWTTLEGSFASQSTARAMQIRGALQKEKKLDSSVTVFFNKVKSMADTLASIGQPLRPEEFTGYLCAGLDSDYDPIVALVSARALTNPMPVRDIYEQLLNTEQRVNERRGEVAADVHMAANYGARSGGGKPSYPQNYQQQYRSQDSRQHGKPAFTKTSPPMPVRK
jgi:hypothetical protein